MFMLVNYIIKYFSNNDILEIILYLFWIEILGSCCELVVFSL